MKKSVGVGAALLALAGSFFGPSAGATPLLCQDPAVNHMYVDTSYVSACLGAGIGNINGNPATDDFIKPTGEGAGLGLVGIGSGSYSQAGSTGTFSIDASLWSLWNSIAIGFKFGTGDKPDEWFVYSLNSGVTSGIWEFVNMYEQGGGLSHVQLYGMPGTTNVPEPGVLALFGLGMLGFGLVRRRRNK